jgi:cytidyltransferase-like protein
VRIYTKVVADLFHFGHVASLRAARELGTHLTVCVVPDERVALLKRRPIMTTEERVQVVAACRYVDAVITDGPRVTTLAFMRSNDFALYAFGAKDEAEYLQKRQDCAELPEAMLRRLPYARGVSSTEIRRRVLANGG